jgi:hypothetical protein
VEGQEYYIAMVKAYRKKNKLPGLKKKKCVAMCRSIGRLYRDYETSVANQKAQKILQKFMTERKP